VAPPAHNAILVLPRITLPAASDGAKPNYSLLGKVDDQALGHLLPGVSRVLLHRSIA
jgi:hypothetical protein